MLRFHDDSERRVACELASSGGSMLDGIECGSHSSGPMVDKHYVRELAQAFVDSLAKLTQRERALPVSARYTHQLNKIPISRVLPLSFGMCTRLIA